VIKVGTDASVVDAQNKTGAVITANQGVKHWVVYGCNDESETGAVTALQNGNVKPENIIGVGLGAYLTCKDWKAKKVTGNRAALFISGAEVGRSAVEALVKAIKDKQPLPPKTIAKTAMVDAESYEQAGVVCT
jgi:L-arabinose transport system substrate-binding protein